MVEARNKTSAKTVMNVDIVCVRIMVMHINNRIEVWGTVKLFLKIKYSIMLKMPIPRVVGIRHAPQVILKLLMLMSSAASKPAFVLIKRCPNRNTNRELTI